MINDLKLEKEIVTKKSKIFSIIFLTAYIILLIMPSVIYYLNKAYYLSGLIICNVILIIISIFVFKERLQRDIKALKSNFKKYLKYIIKNQIMLFAIYYAVSIIGVLIMHSPETSINQQELLKMPMAYLIFCTLIYAPIVEELVFRGSIRRFIKNDKIFVITSGIIFGLLHTAMESSVLAFFIKGLPYITIGLYLAHLYVNTENITTNIISHFIHNLFCLIIIQFIS